MAKPQLRTSPQTGEASGGFAIGEEIAPQRLVVNRTVE
jgi:hypothetical protein